jgi:ribosomal protein L28
MPVRPCADLIRTQREPTTRPISEDTMARSCAICGKVSMGGFNPQSSGMNRVRAHRRYQPNLQPFTTRDANGNETKSLVCTRCRRTSLKSAK